MTDAKNTNQSPVQQGEVMIHVENLKKSFGDNLVLNGITQDIRKGEKVVIIGPSGSGKSTFLRCLNLLEVPTSGHIIFEGTDLTDKDTDINAIRRKMGMVFQHFNLFPNMTVRRNITLAPVRTGYMKQEEADAEAERLLARVGLLDKADAESGMTMAVVTHEMGFAREVGTRVLFIDEGIVKEENTPQEFFSNPQNPRLQDFLSKVL